MVCRTPGTVITERPCSWENGNSPNMSAGFDQEAASVLLARLAVTRIESGLPGADIQRWIDRTLIRTVS